MFYLFVVCRLCFYLRVSLYSSVLTVFASVVGVAIVAVLTVVAVVRLMFFQTVARPNSIDWLWRRSKAKAEAEGMCYFVVGGVAGLLKHTNFAVIELEWRCFDFWCFGLNFGLNFGFWGDFDCSRDF